MIQLLSLLAVTAVFQEDAKFEPVMTISTGSAFTMDKALVPERPNLVVFYQETSSADKDLVQQLSEKAVKSQKVALRLVKLKNLDQAAAKEHSVTETPTLIVFDRFGVQLARTSKMEEIDAAMMKALKMARIKWVSESDPEAETTYRMMGGGKQPVADIMKTMSLQPQWMELVARLAGIAHFSPNTNLPKKTKEMIATYVSAINHCKFWVGSHAGFLQAAGADKELVDAVALNDLAKTSLNDKDKALLDFVRILTVEPWMTRDAHVVRMRKAGWTDAEIFEAAFITSLFAFFNRMADAYGLDYPTGGWLPPALQK